MRWLDDDEEGVVVRSTQRHGRGLQRSQRQVQTVTRPLTQHDTTTPPPPCGGPAWSNEYMPSYVVHVGEADPMVEVAEDMYRL